MISHAMGSWGNPQGISQGINGCLLSKAVLLTKPGIAEGCALDKMVDCEVEESRAGSRDDEMEWSCDGVEGSRRRHGSLKRFEIFEYGGTLTTRMGTWMGAMEKALQLLLIVLKTLRRGRVRLWI